MTNHNHYVACPLCGVNNYQIRFPATRPQRSGNSFQHFCCTSPYLAQHDDIVQCRECGMTYTNPQPKAEELLALYTNIEDPQYVQEQSGRRYTFQRSLHEIHGFCHPPGKLLDVGCYTGTFMEISKAEGWDVYGTELSAWAANIARQSGFGPVYEGTLDQIGLPTRGFDVITAWDVIEHVPQPVTMLNDIAALLKPGGLFALSTYVVDSWPVRILGTRYPFFMDMHLIHFSRATLKRMLSEHGYEILDIRPHQRVISLQYFLERIEHILPVGRSLIRWFANQRQVKKRFVKVGFSGLVNVFARCTKSS